jgi:flavin-dependent dehydrogenase
VERYDVTIIGGGLTGAAAGRLVRRCSPDARVLLVEASPSFEPTCLPTGDVSGIFLTRRLRLWDHLARMELPSHGARFWFHNDDVLRIQGATELGTRLLPPTPAFLLREDVLAEHILEQAGHAGCEILRPARVTDVQIAPHDSRLSIRTGGETVEVASTWVLDASGRATVLGRKLGLVQPNTQHPVAAIVGRWRGDLDLDGPGFAPETDFGRGALVSRRLCCNHFQGYGYRVIFTPLADRRGDAPHELAVALLFDKRVLDLHRSEDIGDAYSAFLSGLPATRQLLQRAELPRQALQVIPQLAYDATEFAGPGWALMGSASGFMDLCCSPGADHAARTVEASVALVVDHLSGRPIDAALSRHNRDFRRSWTRSFQARFKDRYLVDGDFDLFWPSFLLDRALYMLTEVAPVTWRTSRYLRRPPMAGPVGAVRAWLMRWYSSRFLLLARRRMLTGHYGRANAGGRLHYRSDIGWGSLLGLFHGLAGWGVREIESLGLLVDWLRGDRSMPEGADQATLPEGTDLPSGR